MTSVGQASLAEHKRASAAGGRVGANPSGYGLAIAILLAGVLATLILSLVFAWNARNKPVDFSTPYQGVLLTNGSVYFGKLSGYGTSTPMLTNVFYVVSRTDATTKQVSNVLVKRGKELHGPDRMFISPSQIVFVETVGTNSKVAQLIAQSGSQ